MRKLHKRLVNKGTRIARERRRGLLCGSRTSSLGAGNQLVPKNDSTPYQNANKVSPTQAKQTTSQNESTMLSFPDFKKSLGVAASKYSDEQIEVLRIACDKMADAAFDQWLQQRNTGTMH